MGALLALSRAIDAINRAIGKLFGWLVLVAVLVSAVNASVRYIFSNSSNAWLELQWYLFAGVFLMCAPYTLLMNEHIRIDIISGRMSKTARNWLEVIGLVFFLAPLCIIMLYEGWQFFLQSYPNEQSNNAGGLLRWPVKSLILFGFGLLLAQTVSELIKRVAVMQGRIADPHASKSGAH